MGVPALFRWLSQKYPKIISSVIEEQPQEFDGQYVPVDTTGPNPNGEEQDNLYLDMNGIVHPCSHPEDRPPPETEEEMMMEIFKYTERVVAMVRPRKVLMMAVDGVAPRAKMNQQRSRRFRSAQEAKEKEEQMAEFVQMLATKGTTVDESLKKRSWDSNAITPGTPFMDILCASLRYWVAYKLNTDPAWAKLKVIISDSSVPGEGEHKIMEFVRSQRGDPEHDPNTRHVIYGLDADLIMLGLATHEPHFRVIREDVFAADSRARVCAVCNQKGHRAEECTGKAKEKEGEFDEKSHGIAKKPFVWLHVGVLREYLEVELQVPGLSFTYDLERALDDWVFMCFFVGNDFLPHLPSLEIRDQGIDTLITIWRESLDSMGGYVTKDGHVNMARAQRILESLGRQEDAIFKKRKEVETRREESAKRRKLNDERNKARNGDGPAYRGKGERPPSGIPSNIPLFAAARPDADSHLHHASVVDRAEVRNANMANKSAAAALKAQLLGGAKPEAPAPVPTPEAEVQPLNIAQKRKVEALEETPVMTPESVPEAEAEVVDTVRLWEPGYRDRYYEQKFKVSAEDFDFRKRVAHSYVEGLCWVLLYYYQGCPSWTWYYPYHYAPFAQDCTNLNELKLDFKLGKPFRPWEQLMAVLPAASKHNLPEQFGPLMTEPDSEIIDFYPETFPLDLNGKKFAWQGVALLPFIDEKRLLDAIAKVYPKISAEDMLRNTLGSDTLFISEQHPLYDKMIAHFFSKKAVTEDLQLDSRVSEGLAGQVQKDAAFIPHSTITFPLSGVKSDELRDIEDDRSMSVLYELPKKKHTHKSMLLRGLIQNPPALTPADLDMMSKKQQNGGRTYGGGHFNGNNNSSYNNNRGGNSHRNNNYNSNNNNNGYNNYNNNNNNNNSYAPPPGVRGPTIPSGYGMIPPGLIPPPSAIPIPIPGQQQPYGIAPIPQQGSGFQYGYFPMPAPGNQQGGYNGNTNQYNGQNYGGYGRGGGNGRGRGGYQGNDRRY